MLPIKELFEKAFQVISETGFPSFTNFLAISDIIETFDIPTAQIAAANNVLTIYYNPEFIKGFASTPTALAGVLIHELFHHIFKHFELFTEELKDNHEVANCALDSIVNQTIHQISFMSGYDLTKPFRDYYTDEEIGYILKPPAINFNGEPFKIEEVSPFLEYDPVLGMLTENTDHRLTFLKMCLYPLDSDKPGKSKVTEHEVYEFLCAGYQEPCKRIGEDVKGQIGTPTVDPGEGDDDGVNPDQNGGAKPDQSGDDAEAKGDNPENKSKTQPQDKGNPELNNNGKDKDDFNKQERPESPEFIHDTSGNIRKDSVKRQTPTNASEDYNIKDSKQSSTDNEQTKPKRRPEPADKAELKRKLGNPVKKYIQGDIDDLMGSKVLAEFIKDLEKVSDAAKQAGFSNILNNYMVKLENAKDEELKQKLLRDTLDSIRVSIMRDLNGAKANPMSSVLMPNNIAGKDLLGLYQKIPPTFWQKKVPATSKKKLFIYIDVSGSMYGVLHWMLGLIVDLSRMFELELYYFSNIVEPTTLDEIKKGIIKSTGGTDIDCIIEHIISRKQLPKKAIIFTDGYINCRKENIDAIKKSTCDLTYVLLGNDVTECSIVEDTATKVYRIHKKQKGK